MSERLCERVSGGQARADSQVPARARVWTEWMCRSDRVRCVSDMQTDQREIIFRAPRVAGLERAARRGSNALPGYPTVDGRGQAERIRRCQCSGHSTRGITPRPVQPFACGGSVPCAYSYGHTGLDTHELDNLDWSHDDDTPVRRGRPRDPPARHPPGSVAGRGTWTSPRRAREASTRASGLDGLSLRSVGKLSR